jgi:predicted nucleotide-binding protein
VGTALRLLDAIETEVAAVEQAIAVTVADDRGVRHLLTVPAWAPPRAPVWWP